MKDFFRKIVVSILTFEARAVLRKYKPHVIVVTGSVGKTSTKDAVFSALKHHAFVRKSEKSFNSDIGVPLTILGLPNGWGNIIDWIKNIFDGFLILLITTPFPRWLVVEVGADRPGDISKALRWLSPDVVVTTRFPDVPVHVEFYESPKEVIAEELFPLSLLKQGGTAVVNSEDEHASAFTLPDQVKKITYGFGKDADVRASHYRVLTKKGMPNGISFTVSYGEEKLHVSLYGVIGTTHVYAALGGIAGAIAAGAALSEMAHFAESHTTPPGRMNLVEGIEGAVLIDDSYNASPVATEEALKTLHDVSAPGKKIAVLGDMLELGNFSAEEHKKIGEVVKNSADMLVTVGVRARAIATRAEALGMPQKNILSFEKGSEAIDALLSRVQNGDVLLFKGSQSMRMERIVKALMAHPEDAAKLLPRQDTEWLLR